MSRKKDIQADGLFELAADLPRTTSFERGPGRRYHINWPRYDKYRPEDPRSSRVTVGLLQCAPQLRSAADNVQFLVECLSVVEDAVIVLPEFFLSSYSCYAEAIFDRKTLAQLLAPLQDLSRRSRISLVGSLPVRKGDHDTNNVVVIDNGMTRFSIQDKGRLFGREEQDFTAGTDRRRLWVKGLPVSVQICMDIVDPIPVRCAVTEGARVIIGPSAVSVDYLRTIHKARALENQVVSVFCNRFGEDVNGVIYMGRSTIFFPDGAELAAPGKEPQLLTATIDMAYVLGFEERFGIRG